MLPRVLVLTGLAVLGSFAIPDTASAQLPFSRQGTYLYQEYGRSQPAYNYNAPAPAAEPSRAFYPSAEAGMAQIVVNLPPGARVTFDGAATSSTGSWRRFVSPELTPGVNYTYDVQATWMENGREVTQKRAINVRAGEVVNLTITNRAINVN